MYTVFVEEVCFMETIKNVLVGQSGGPTAVINASLAGVYETARAMGAEHLILLQRITHLQINKFDANIADIHLT